MSGRTESLFCSFRRATRRLFCRHEYALGLFGRWRTPDGRIPRKGEYAVFVQTFACRCGKVTVRG